MCIVHCQRYLSHPRLFTPETRLARKLGSSRIRGGCNCLKWRGAKSGHQRFSVGQKRSGRADGSWWLGYFGLEEAESVICFSFENRGGWSRARKWWKCFCRICPGSPYQQSQQVRITLALISKSSWWNVIRILWHARFWTRKSLLIKICNEKKLKKNEYKQQIPSFSWYFVQNAIIIKSY